MTNWISELIGNIAGEFSTRPAIATLATVRESSSAARADARIVVIRRVMEDATLLITSDARSEKNGQLRANSSAAAVFWFPSLRKQFIVHGQVRIIGADDMHPIREQAWRDLSDSTRATFHWPPTGMPRDETVVFCSAIGADAAIPPAFEVLLLKAASAETLDLNPRPHLREKWVCEHGDWLARTLNP